MRKDGHERRTELARKAVHVGSGLIALALGKLTWPQALALALAALVFNALVLPRVGGKALHRVEDLRRGHAFGILMYPLSVVILVLAFRAQLEFVAIGWALMAFGDGMASVVGSLAGRHHLPWNRKKSWEGIAAHVVFGAAAALALGAFVAQARGSAIPLAPLAACILLAAVITAVVESIDSGVDDNLLVPLLGAGLCFVLLRVLLSGRLSAEVLLHGETASRAALASAACLALAIAAFLRGTLTRVGAAGAAILGTVVATGGGWPLFASLCAFFAIGVGATRLGREVKEARGIAEARGGRRGLGNVLANGGMAGLCALLAFSGPDAGAAIACGVAALATSAFDTVSSEVGKAFGRRTFLPTTLRAVPPGTEGAVSLEGTLAGAAGALAVAVPLPWAQPSGQPGTLGLAVLAALAGSTFESVIGALCHERGHRVQNDLMNFANTVVGAATMAALISLTA